MNRFLVIVFAILLAGYVASASTVNMLSHRRAPTINLNVDNTVTLRGVVDANSIYMAQDALHELVKKRADANYPLFLVLDTPGGEVEAGEVLIQYAKNIRNLHTITIFAASMGAAIVEGLPGRRLITNSGVIMFHRAALTLEGQFEDGEVESRLEFYKLKTRSMEQRNADRMSMSLQDYKKAVKDEMWLSDARAVSAHASDAIVDLSCSEELIEQEQTIQMQVMIFTLNLKFSGCPLFRIPKVALDSQEKVKAYQDNYRYIKSRFSPSVL